MKKIKILHLIKKYKGNNPLLNSMILGLDDRFNANACYLSGNPDGENVLDRHGKAVYLGADKKSKLFVIRTLARFLKSEQPLILHCHRNKATMLGTAAAIFSGIPYVISHVHGMNRTRRLRTRMTNWLLLRHTALIIGVSESVRRDILKTNWGLDPEKVVTVWNGIEISSIDTASPDKKLARSKMGVSENNFVFGSVGRLVKTKGHENLLKSFSEISKKSPDAKLVILGDGPLRRDLEEHTMDLGITPKVVFAGFRSDVPELLPGFDGFVLPSVAEGLSLALLEAMASKLPVIASDVGGIPEVLNEPRHGLLVNPEKTGALSAAMEQIYLMTPDKRKVMGEAARKRIEDEFSAAKMCRNLSDVYDSILRKF